MCVMKVIPTIQYYYSENFDRGGSLNETGGLGLIGGSLAVIYDIS